MFLHIEIILVQAKNLHFSALNVDFNIQPTAWFNQNNFIKLSSTYF